MRSIVVLLALVATACGTARSDPPPSPVTIAIHDFKYVPEVMTVARGTTVTWRNEDFFGHTVTSGAAGMQTATFDGVLGDVAAAEGASFSHTFEQPGSFIYFCRFHPNMTAKVVVE